MITVIILICLCIQLVLESQDTYLNPNHPISQQLHHNGFVELQNILSLKELVWINQWWSQKSFVKIQNYIFNQSHITPYIQNILGKNYILQDYTYFIGGSSNIHTFHRDYTNSKKSYSLQYPSYTLLIYFNYSGIGLSMIPTSHRNYRSIYLLNRELTITPLSGNGILFNADLLHSSSLIRKALKRRRCVQLKICHKLDRVKLKHIDNRYEILDKSSHKPYSKKWLEHKCTQHFPIIVDSFSNQVKSSFDSKKTPLQKWISKIIFGNETFYKPQSIHKHK